MMPINKVEGGASSMVIISSYLTTCLESPANAAIKKIKKIYFPTVAANYNLTRHGKLKRLKEPMQWRR